MRLLSVVHDRSNSPHVDFCRSEGFRPTPLEFFASSRVNAVAPFGCAMTWVSLLTSRRSEESDRAAAYDLGIPLRFSK